MSGDPLDSTGPPLIFDGEETFLNAEEEIARGLHPGGYPPRPTPLRRNDTSRHRFRRIPYGMWTTKDGTEVLFDRDYNPFLLRRGRHVEVCEHHWVENIVEARHFYDDGPRHKPATIRRLLVVLDLFLSGDPIPEKYGWKTK